jgi:hypothetical protein
MIKIFPSGSIAGRTNDIGMALIELAHFVAVVCRVTVAQTVDPSTL